ncbi:MAG: phasin family protein [Burkholderiales bacterium]|jgi:hypothetical protein|nr:phasin family protein [Burkholderiales bacterium]
MTNHKELNPKALKETVNALPSLLSSIIEADQQFFKARVNANNEYIRTLTSLKDISQIVACNTSYMQEFSNDLRTLTQTGSELFNQLMNTASANNNWTNLMDFKQNPMNILYENMSPKVTHDGLWPKTSE